MSPALRTPLSTLAETPAGLVDTLRSVVGEVGVRATDRLASAHDASHYLMTPQAVVRPNSITEVAGLLRAAHRVGAAVTFRSGGTSLSGQAVTENVLVDVRRHFGSIEVLDDGARVRCGAGAVLRQVNARLQRHGRKLGPDPASEIACTIGGIVANNSSGMACGIEANTYKTLDSSVFVLPSGTVVDTSQADAGPELATAEPELYAGLVALRDELRADAESVRRINQLYSIKNTMGYGVNSFLDHTEPVRILEHLVIGSEGTLAFLAEATFRTVKIRPHAATGLLIFPDLARATASLPELVAAKLVTVELMDATSLRVSQRDPKSPEEITTLTVKDHCALLVEFQEADEPALQARLDSAADLWTRLPLTIPAQLTTDAGRRAAFWHTRKGLFTAVAGNRPQGTTALLEDIAVPVERLGETCEALNQLFAKHGYDDAVIFGHAKDGNIHFMVTESFGAGPATDVDRYAAFTEDMVECVLARGGTLKAEHGTGRIMAPFVRRQVGDQLYSVMQRVKALVDPQQMLNPGVLLTEDAQAHLKHLKTSPAVEEEVDRCVECGYCEPVCPSRRLTTTPRERIVLRREIARAEAAGDETLARTLREEYQYDALETCAADGMCETACPVFINTGDLVRRLREETSSAPQQRAWRAAAAHWGFATQAGSLALSAAGAVPAALPRVGSNMARSILGHEGVPGWTADLPGGGQRRLVLRDPQAEAVWFSSCTQTMFGSPDEQQETRSCRGVGEAFQRLCEVAGVRLRTPESIPALCCGTPWKSKGMSAGYEHMRRAVSDALWEASDGGRLPVVSDASSCTEGLEVLIASSGLRERRIQVLDAITFTADRLLPALRARGTVLAQPISSLTLHPTCSSTRLGVNYALDELAHAVASEVHVPEAWDCCAFAGDRGMLHPELTESATRAHAVEVNDLKAAAHASTNRTCEIGMTRATGQPYRHILELLASALPPR
ncbi:FAD-binding and (Fe-S)-binding domain-containing protein [Nesterenkonia jeotgali]|uniref:D-lactate dehydrogenase (cytochrome) n=1 Tax=Nesterenkonia jeotgali TaxID=317018 RepID=A0A0W8IIS3_9MICC|nr:FAD-binding and (Fe-S)-binding domain-containing protein [Nesterenkonia jeotgali]KUG59536.1 oxidoreductase [Nesterenkonia jeotgali]MBA8922250.1 D-lactate dehydrogenase [Nesterenkonia jeotgali]